MARIDTLNNFLTDVAGAIKEKREDDTPIKASNFDIEILNLSNDKIEDYIDPSLVYGNEANGYLMVRIIRQIPYIDTSNVTNASYMFSRFSALEELQELDCSKMNNINAMFASCQSLIKMGGLKNLGLGFPKSATANNTNYTLNLTNAPLDYESAMNIINGVADIKSLGIASQTIRFSSYTFALLSDEDIAIVTTKGWNVTT